MTKYARELADDIRRHNRWHKEPFTEAQIGVIADCLKFIKGSGSDDRRYWLDYIAGRCGPGGGKIKKED
ncbi:hypothetical protein LCGC14_1498290 [marine sediment metagenome]|uniref:Uncharacterized protein n=1 Tax=marine sediment metagenome TaxID=412755 RepID=A0A0F9LKI4_9ZZZZ